MDTLLFLENLAKQAIFFKKDTLSTKGQSQNVQTAFRENKIDLLRSELSNQTAFAHESHVVQSLVYRHSKKEAA